MTPAPADDTIATSEDRRREIRAHHHNGLDIVEVHENRRQLTLMFLEQTPQHLRADNIRIDGPSDQPALTVTAVRHQPTSDPRLRDHLLAELSATGGAGVYRIRLVEARPDGGPGTTPLRSLDPRFTSCTVRFDVDEPAAATLTSQPRSTSTPATAASYLARDYQSLRQILIDGLAQNVPGWSEQHIPDPAIMLVELFAFLGDDLSYYQDAVATEAYLQTARRRISIRRHARLLGYPFHEGCQARSWIEVQVDADSDLPLVDVAFTAQTATSTITFTPIHATLPAPYAAGETVHGRSGGAVIALRKSYNEIEIWGWGESITYLPLGATDATLAVPAGESTRLLPLQPGDLLMFDEIAGADGGPPDETHRHVVRLTRVTQTEDPLFGRALLDISWDPLDALPFQLAVTTPSSPSSTPKPCSVARANVILVGEGQRVIGEDLDPDSTALAQPDLTWSCPYPDLNRVALHQAVLLKNLYHSWREQVTRWRRNAERGDPLDAHQRAELTRQFGDAIIGELGLRGDPDTPPEERADIDALALWILLARADDLLEDRRSRLLVLCRLAAASGPLSGPLLAEVRHDWGEDITHGLDPHHPASWGAAVEATTQDPTNARPVLELFDAHPDPTGAATRWEITTDLVDAEPENRRVIVEMDNDRTAHLRFNPATQPHGPLRAGYLVGNGAAGNVAAETITGVVATAGATAVAGSITSVRNPLPATGGQDPETIDHARRAIPGSYLAGQPRALTPDDYVRLANAVPGVRNSAAVLRWSGNRLDIRVAVQPSLGEHPSRSLLQQVDHTLVTARRIGHDLDVTAPDYRPVTITLLVRLDDYTIRDVARGRIAELLGGAMLADGRPAFFHPSHFSFGQPLYRSALIAAVQEAPGVISVTVQALRFLTEPVPANHSQVRSVLNVSPTAIIRCDNDPAAPESGYAQLTLVGGR